MKFQGISSILLLAVVASASPVPEVERSVIDGVAKGAGSVIGGLWGAVVPQSAKDASIVAAGGRVPGGSSTGGGGVFDSIAGAVGGAAGAVFAGVVPGDTTDSAIKAAGGRP